MREVVLTMKSRKDHFLIGADTKSILFERFRQTWPAVAELGGHTE